MKIFDDDILSLREYVESRRAAGRSVRISDFATGAPPWVEQFKADRPPIVMAQDTWLELGAPGSFSTALALVTENSNLVRDGAITVIGPDISEAQGRRPFAQIVLIASDALQDEDYRRINTCQYELELSGYMIKAVPSSLTIWSRISKKVAAAGFSFEILGNAIFAAYRAAFRISAIEVIFVTSEAADVEGLKGLHTKVTRIIGAMNKMIEEMSFDCSSCEYLDVCGDVRQLGLLREKLMRERSNG